MFWSPAGGARVVAGDVGGRWFALGGRNGVLGYPVGDMLCGLQDGGCLQQFQGGRMYWSPGTGAHWLRGVVIGAYEAESAQDGVLGYPTGDESCGLPRGGCEQAFEGGVIPWSPTTGAHAMSGPALPYWARGDGVGYPETDLFCGLVDDGCGQHFERGAMYYSRWSSLQFVSGVFLDEWAANGWEEGPLGYPTSPAYYYPGDPHWEQSFQHGWISVYPGQAPSVHINP